jgi:predicted TIM-barrel fold metal-dependent hydrolase
MQPTIIRAPIRELLSTGRCLIDLAEEWDVPVLIHSSIDPMDTWSQAADILDVAEEWPAVRFCLAHSCRFDQPSLERLGGLSNTWFDCSAHCIHCDSVLDGLPNVAVSERRVQADYTRPDAVLKVLAEMLPDRLMWGSDAPFYSYAAKHDERPLRLLSSYAREVAALDLLTASERLAVLHDNTIRFLGRPVV